MTLLVNTSDWSLAFPRDRIFDEPHVKRAVTTISSDSCKPLLRRLSRGLKLPLIYSVVALIAACASTGYVTTSDHIVPKTVILASSLDPEVASYAPRFISILGQHGFAVGTSNNPHAMELRLDFNGNPFNMRVGAALWHDGVPILTASATNSGWGTALARGTAVQNLADSCAKNFERELSELQPHLRIVDQPTATR